MQNGINIMIDEFYKIFYRLKELSLKQDIRCLTINEISDKLNVAMGTSNVINLRGIILLKRATTRVAPTKINGFM